MCVPKKERERKSKKKGEMESSTNIIVYFNGDALNTGEGMTLVCSRPNFFPIQYMISLVELENRLCQCIDANTPKAVEKK